MYEVKAYIREANKGATIDALAQLDGVTGIAVVQLHEFGHRPGNGKLTRVAIFGCSLARTAPNCCAPDR